MGGKFKNLRDLARGSKQGEKVLASKEDIAKYLQTEEGKVLQGLARNNRFSVVSRDMKAEEIANFNPVKEYKTQPSEKEIIDTLGGPDLTRGSCASLALAYTAQRGGLEVLDFRGGESRGFFASSQTKADMFEESLVGEGARTVKGAAKVLKLVDNAPVGKEFLLATGNHMAVICKDAEGWIDYLELQNPDHCGWRSLGNPMTEYGKGEAKDVLRDRFKAQMFFKNSYKKKQWKSSLIDCDKLRESEAFKVALGFINTDKDKQKKSSAGSEK